MNDGHIIPMTLGGDDDELWRRTGLGVRSGARPLN